jgi:hypothetical protein
VQTANAYRQEQPGARVKLEAEYKAVSSSGALASADEGDAHEDKPEARESEEHDDVIYALVSRFPSFSPRAGGGDVCVYPNDSGPDAAVVHDERCNCLCGRFKDGEACPETCYLAPGHEGLHEWECDHSLMPPRPSRPPPLAQANAILQKAVEVKLPLNRKTKSFSGGMRALGGSRPCY